MKVPLSNLPMLQFHVYEYQACEFRSLTWLHGPNDIQVQVTNVDPGLPQQYSLDPMDN